MRFLGLSLPVGHPDFGKTIPCPDCQGPILAAKQAEAEQEAIDRLITSAGISPRHMYSFEDFYALPDEMRAGKEQAAELCKTLATDGQVTYEGVCKVGLVLYGEFGTLKTTLGTAALMERARAGYPVLRVKFADFLDDVKDTYGRKDRHAEDLIRAAQKAQFVLLDDMGKPGVIQQMKPDEIRITHKLLEYRNEFLLPLIGTSNCIPALLKMQIGERTYERLRELCHFIKVSGENLRQ